jgi:hypothetical protein
VSGRSERASVLCATTFAPSAASLTLRHTAVTCICAGILGGRMMLRTSRPRYLPH